jgi:hypothetical protein
MNDCEVAEPYSEIQQGDIVIRADWNAHSPTDRIAVLITADCDIAHQKFGDYLSAVPVVSIDHYVQSFLMLKELKATSEALHVEIRKSVEPLLGLHPSSSSPTRTALVSWVMDGAVSDLPYTENLKPRDAKRLEIMKSVYREILGTDEENRMSRSKHLVVRGNSAVRDSDNTDAQKKLIGAIKSHLRQLPQDIFFLTHIPGAPRPLSDNLGFLVLLREVRPIRADAVVTTLSESRGRDQCFVRTARLLAPFKQALMQRFANVFAKIGLPEDYENDQRQIIQGFCDGWNK